jgi:response regulator RpfG family c-di-GMP phosphodiesterase
MKILIVDDSSKWIAWHECAIREIFKNNVIVDTALCAKQGVEKLTYSIDEPYDFILTDMQMEPDFIPLYAGEWFIKQIKFFNEYKNTKIIIISGTSNIKQIAETYNVDFIPKYKCNDINAYCNKLLKNE